MRHLPWYVFSTHAIFESPASPIWHLLADFNGLPELLPEVVSSEVDREGVGARRTLTFADGKKAEETLIVFHPELHRLAYAMRDPAPFPWSHYFATQQLQPLGSELTHFAYTGYWQGHGTAEAEVGETLRWVYHSVFDGISRKLGVAHRIIG